MTSLFTSEDNESLLPPPSSRNIMNTTNSRDIPISSFPNIEPNVPTDILVPGQFEYVNNNHEREMYVNAWQAITLTENWDFVKADIESFMWSENPKIDIISSKMSELGYHGHSGSSFGFIMRKMQYIARNGEKNFKEEYLKSR